MDIFGLFQQLKKDPETKHTITLKYVKGEITADEYLKRMKEIDRTTD